MATRIIPIGPEQQINQAPGQDGFQVDPDIAVLPDGRYLAVFSDISAPSHIGGQFINANGTLAGGSLVDGNTPDHIGGAGAQTNASIVARLDGNALVVWQGGGDVALTVLNAAGNEVTPGGELNVITGTTNAGDNQTNPDAATLSDGRSIVVWENAAAESDIHARILNAAGTGFTTADRLVIDAAAGFQIEPAVAASGLRALIAYQDSGTNTIAARLFDGSTNTFGAKFAIATGGARFALQQSVDVAALPDNRFVVVYCDTSVDPSVFAVIFDPETPDGPFISAPIAVSLSGITPHVAATIDGGFIVAWAQDVDDALEIGQRRFDAHGAPYGDIAIVNTLRDEIQGDPVVATSGANVFTVWGDQGTAGRADTDLGGIRGQAAVVTAFDYDSARFGELDGNSRADILFQNDTGDLTLWRTNAAGVLSAIDGIGSLPAGFRIDGTGNFNATAGDDILLRSPTQIAVLPMNGITPQPMQVLGNASPDFVSSGIGDFSGDGQSDLLLRNIVSNQIVTWSIVNNALAAAPQVLGSAPGQFRIVAVDDFTGDRQADILFRGDNDIVLWRVANNALAGAPQVTGTASQSFHVVGTGDFDGNLSDDILFRGDSGQLAVWLLNSSGQLLGAPQAVGIAPLEYHVDGTGDLNGDGRSDIALRHANGQIVTWFMNGASFAQAPAVLGTIAVDHAIAAHHFDLV
jgi:hypothetical protein